MLMLIFNKINHFLTLSFKFEFIIFAIFTSFLIVNVKNVQPFDITLAWDANIVEELAGFRAFYREEYLDYDYNNPAWEGNVKTCTIYGLDPNITTAYYFVVRAFDIFGYETENSNEVRYPTGPNSPPVVEAGPNQMITLPRNAILNGIVTDNGFPIPPGVVTTKWSKVSGTGTVTFSDASASYTIAGFSEAGSYVLRLTADDGELIATDDTTITVNPEPDLDSPSPDPMTWEILPHATGAYSVSMTVTTSTDSSGAEYYFECIAGGGNNSLWQDSPSYEDTGLNPGKEYTYRVKARDKSPHQNETNWSLQVSAVTEANLPPVVEAGTYQMITLPGDMALDGTIKDDGVPNPPSIVTTIWSKVSGKGTVTFADASDIDTMISFSEAGTYVLRLTAHDGELIASDDTTIMVNPEPDVYPPSPDPITWEILPHSTKPYLISMTATTATEPSGAEYYFECIDGEGHDSLWQESPVYEDTGLMPDREYTYRVKARDKSPCQNETNWSLQASAITAPGVRILGSWVSGTSHKKEQGHNRALLFIAHAEDNNMKMNLLSVTYGDQTMMKIIDRNAKSHFWNYVVAYLLDEEGIASAVGDTFTLTWESIPNRKPAFSSVFIENVDQAVFVGDMDSNGSKRTNTLTTGALITNPGDMVIVAGTSGKRGIYSFNNNFTKTMELSIVSADGVTGYKPATGVPEIPSIIHSGINCQVIIGFVVKASAASASDLDPPNPDPITWQILPHATGAYSISMTAKTASDQSGVKYYFECTAGKGNNSLWQDSPTYEDNGLFPDTEYTYRVKARDKSTNLNETNWSQQASVTTKKNTLPIACNQSITTAEDTSVAIILAASDIDLDPLTYTVVVQPSNGKLSRTTPNIIYSPNANYNGTDSFTFKSNDRRGDSDTAIISITVIPVNDPPVVSSQTFFTQEDVAIDFTLAASDIDGDGLTYSIVTNSSKGNVTITDPATGAFTYTPFKDMNGSDTLGVRVNDGITDSATATVTINITPINDVPVANSQYLDTNENTAVFIVLTGSDVEGDILNYTILTQPSHGTLLGTAPYITYRPNDNYSGTDSLSFKVSDISEDSNAATVSINIYPVTKKITRYMTLKMGCNMISLPVEFEDSRARNLLIKNSVAIYSYEKENGYKRVLSAKDLEIGKGYWIILVKNQNFILTGKPIRSYSSTVYEDGWIMIGGCSSPAKALADGCNIRVIYGYKPSAGYYRVLESEPLEYGKGYWIFLDNVTKQCKLKAESIVNDF